MNDVGANNFMLCVLQAADKCFALVTGAACDQDFHKRLSLVCRMQPEAQAIRQERKAPGEGGWRMELIVRRI